MLIHGSLFLYCHFGPQSPSFSWLLLLPLSIQICSRILNNWELPVFPDPLYRYQKWAAVVLPPLRGHGFHSWTKKEKVVIFFFATDFSVCQLRVKPTVVSNQFIEHFHIWYLPYLDLATTKWNKYHYSLGGSGATLPITMAGFKLTEIYLPPKCWV